MTERTRNFLHILRDWISVFVIYIVMIFLLLLLLANWSLPYFSVMKPQLFLIAVFYWTLYRPRFMPLWVVFVAGIFLDVMNPVLPLGTHAFSYLLIAGLLWPRRRMIMGQPFIAVWVWFAVAVLMDMVMKSIIVAAISPAAVHLFMMGLSSFVTILAFPLFLMMFVMLQRMLPPVRALTPS